VQPGERIGLPAILGLHRHTATRTLLEQLTRATVFESPTAPPSVPGIRLFNALHDHLATLGVRIETGMEVISTHTTPPNGQPGRVLSVSSATSARPLAHHARTWLLATGGLLGGGFNSDHDGRVWETIFNLPLTVPQERGDWFEPAFLSPQGHPVFTGGVAVDGMMRPVGGDNRPIYHNLHAAGHLLADCDPILERSLEGVALASAAAAAQALLAANLA
jgi:glycerol-3-phosphate dehydrogenase subunit B